MASASTSGAGARPWRTALLTLRDESLASPSPAALLELLRRVLLSTASPSLATSAAQLSPHEVGSDVAFLADTAAAAASCPGADDAMRGVCHLIYDVMCKTNMEIDSSGWLAMLKFLDTLVKCSIEGACMKGLSSRTAALNTTSECLHILRFWSRDYGRSISLTESSHSLTVLVSIVSCLQAELNISDKPANATAVSSRNSGSVNGKNSNIWDMKIAAFSMVEDILSKVAPNMTENLWQSVIESDRINLDIKRVVGYRQWCNKLWNAIRFAMGKLGDHYIPPATVDVSRMPPICKWILSVLNKAVGKAVTSLEAYKFSDATSAIYSWWQYQLCDVFIEAIKPYFFNDSQEFESARAASRDTLWICLETGLRLLHPFMPYVTEELWQRLPQPKDSCRKDSIMISEYPSIVEEWSNGGLENEMDIVLDAVNKIRSLKPPTDSNERRPAFALCRGQEIAATIQCYQSLIVFLSSISDLKILTENDETPADCATAVVNKDLSVYLQLQGALNADAEREKLRKKKDEIQKLQHALAQKMDASGYREKAPQSVQEEDMRKLTALLEQLEVISEAEKKLDAN